ncbi:MAG: aminoglycoside phosphotransferase family protein [Candidatus Marinimicrobia bacterium]|nr:aminoglycoside phosphotransferase family protein [Candidatus Neomarinimicrobiota bacterium]
MKDNTTIICNLCHQNCPVQIHFSPDDYTISGHQCQRGILFVYRILGNTPAGSIRPGSLLTEQNLQEILARWKLQYEKVLPDISIQGSPERSEFRIVIQVKPNKRYLLEQIDSLLIERKSEIAAILKNLADCHLPVIPYLKTAEDAFTVKYNHKYWMISPFCDGISLDRAQYWKDSWRGKSLAAFLVGLQKVPSEKSLFSGKSFFLPGFIDDLFSNISKYRNDLYSPLLPVYEYVKETIYSNYEKLPVTFCHGDPHPLNVIWNSDKIKAVIDWEFCGLKPEIFDMALIIGCVGSENPNALRSDFLRAFLDTAKSELISNDLSWKMLPGFIVAIRFAWLSEWLRKQDHEMIRFEIQFMQFLKKNLSMIIPG